LLGAGATQGRAEPTALSGLDQDDQNQKDAHENVRDGDGCF
jgi:hypothetical protein